MRKLLMPRGSDIANRGSEDYAIIGCALDPAQSAISADYPHILSTHRLDMSTRLLYNFVIKINRHYLPLLAHQLPYQCRVIASARTNFQHPLAGLQVQQFQHQRHNPGRRRGTDRLATLPAHNHRLVGVRRSGIHMRHKDMTRNRPQSLFHRRALYNPQIFESINHLLAQSIAAVVFALRSFRCHILSTPLIMRFSKILSALPSLELLTKLMPVISTRITRLLKILTYPSY